MKIYDDYKEMVVDPQKEFMKRHWKGYGLIQIVAYTMIAGGAYVYLKVKGKEWENKFKFDK